MEVKGRNQGYPAKKAESGKGVVLTIVGAIDLILLYGITLMYAQGELAFALLVLILTASGTWVFISSKGYCYRYVYPCLLGIVTFIVFPLIYTVNVAFTNYGSNNLLPLERVQEIHLAKTYRTGGESFTFKMYQEGTKFRLRLFGPDITEQNFATEPFGALIKSTSIKANISSDIPTGAELSMRDVIKKRSILKNLNIILPDGKELALTSLRKFGAISKIYEQESEFILRDTRTGEVIRPDMDTGYYTDQNGTRQIGPGFTIYTGWDNLKKVFTDPGIQKPFFKIFLWTVTFSGLSVLFTLIIGLLMSCLVQWEPLKGNGVYRLLLILPYAVPAFISILIFRGLFNQNFGEINMLLELLFSTKPEWFSNEILAKTMVVIVNTWLGYPYMMILCIGLLKSIPEDLYEASAIDGASPVQNLFNITIPMIIKPLIPLLIASFAFNFNNLVLIALLTGGAPDMLNATTPAGTTDILVSYTFRIAFGSYGQDYGLASAIATVIFIMVGAIAWINLKATKKFQEN